MKKTLSQLLSPVSPKEFFSKHYEKKHLYIPRSQEGFFDHVLSLQDIDEHFQSSEIPMAFTRVTSRNRHWPAETWTSLTTRRGLETVKVVKQDELLERYREGATLVIGAGERLIPKLQSFCRELSEELQFRVQANTYMTPPRSQGLDAHYDTHDVLVLQLYGKKLWNLYDTPAHLPSAKHRFDPESYQKTECSQELCLESGDLLYLPRGLVHEARTEDSSSIHITLGLHPILGFELVETLASLAQEDPFFRESAPHGFSSEAERDHFQAEFIQRLSRLLEKLDLEQQRQGLIRQQSQAWQRSYENRFLDSFRAGDITHETILSKRPGLDVSVTVDSKEIKLSFEGKNLAYPKYLRSVLETCLKSQPFRVSELKGLIGEQGKLELVRALVQQGVLRIDEL